MAEKYNPHVINYCDDFLLINNLAKCQESFTILKKLLRDLGFTLAEKKLISPTKTTTCLGIEVDTEKFQLRIPSEKFEQIKNMCLSWVTVRTCTKRQLQSLLGSLLCITKCVRYSRFFSKQNAESTERP